MNDDDDVDDEPTEEERADWARLVEAVAPTSAVARRFVDDFVKAYGDVLPVLLLGMLGQWFRDEVRQPQNAPDVTAAVQAVSDLFEAGDDLMETIIATGFLEAMPYAHEEDRTVVDLLPAPLRQELRRMETATPPR